MPRNYSNVAVAATVENPGGISTGTTTLILSSTTGMPATPFTMRIRPETVNEELITVTDGLGTATTPYTIVRGVDGTSAKSHPQGAPIVHSISARDFQEPQDHMATTDPGSVHGLPATAWEETRIIAKNVDQSYSNDITYNDDNELRFSVEANSKYRVELNLMAVGDTGNINTNWKRPSGSTGLKQVFGPAAATTSPAATTVRVTAHDVGTPIAYGLATANIICIQEKCILTTGANAGEVIITHAQGTSSSQPTTVKAGSYLVVTKLAS